MLEEDQPKIKNINQKFQENCELLARECPGILHFMTNQAENEFPELRDVKDKFPILHTNIPLRDAVQYFYQVINLRSPDVPEIYKTHLRIGEKFQRECKEKILTFAREALGKIDMPQETETPSKIPITLRQQLPKHEQDASPSRV